MKRPKDTNLLFLCNFLQAVEFYLTLTSTFYAFVHTLYAITTISFYGYNAFYVRNDGTLLPLAPSLRATGPRSHIRPCNSPSYSCYGPFIVDISYLPVFQHCFLYLLVEYPIYIVDEEHYPQPHTTATILPTESLLRSHSYTIPATQPKMMYSLTFYARRSKAFFIGALSGDTFYPFTFTTTKHRPAFTSSYHIALIASTLHRQQPSSSGNFRAPRSMRTPLFSKLLPYASGMQCTTTWWPHHPERN